MKRRLSYPLSILSVVLGLSGFVGTSEAASEEIVWETFVPQLGIGFNDVILTDADIVLAVGHSESRKNIAGQALAAQVARFSSDGRSLYDTVLTTHWKATADRIFRLEANRYLIVGSCQIAPIPATFVWLCHVDGYGNYLWDTALHVSGGDMVVRSARPAANGRYIALVKAKHTSEPVTLMEFTQAGSVSWQREYQELPYLAYNSEDVIPVSEGGYLVTGHHGDADGIRDPFLLRVDEAGEVLWHNTYPMPYQQRSRTLIELSGGRFLASVYTYMPAEGTSFWLFDCNGTLVGQPVDVRPGSGEHVLDFIREASDRFIVVGLSPARLNIARVSTLEGSMQPDRFYFPFIANYPRVRLLTDGTMLATGTRVMRVDDPFNADSTVAGAFVAKISSDVLGVEDFSTSHYAGRMDLR